MRSASVLIVFVAVVGCTTYDTPPPASTTASSSTDPTSDAPGQPAEVLASGENDHIRVVLAGHRVASEEAMVRLDVTNKDEQGVKRFGSALLAFEGTERTLYFDFAANLDARQAGHYELRSNDNEQLAGRPWKSLTVYYREDTGGEFTDDEAVEIPLAGRGLPSNVG